MCSNVKLCYILETDKIKKLSNQIKKNDKTNGTKLPSKLSDNEYIIGFEDLVSNNIVSFIWFGIYENEDMGKFTHINYTFTFEKFRQNGLNKKLRFQIEKFCQINKIQTITSKPFEDSPSKKILQTLGFFFNENYYWKKISI